MVSRRSFIAAAGALVATGGLSRAAASQEVLENQEYSNIKGFNYQPSWGSSGLEIWMRFDCSQMAVELSRGKKYFPGMNAIRFWLSWDAYRRDERRFGYNFEATLACAEKLGIKVMPVLFNRWHNFMLDYGGIYVDHFYPKKDLFRPYLEAVVGKHKADSRIFAWDLCNEPHAEDSVQASKDSVAAAERVWLEDLYKCCKEIGARAPLTVGWAPIVDFASDFLSVHPYYVIGKLPWLPGQPLVSVEKAKLEFSKRLDSFVSAANKANKPLLATETVYGAHLDDAKRIDVLRFTLGELKKRKIGWLAYLLNHSLIADAHRAEYGPVGNAGYMAFIDPDGSLRAGHHAFNEF